MCQFFCYFTLIDYLGSVFDEFFYIFDGRGGFSRFNLFSILTVKTLLQEVYGEMLIELWEIKGFHLLSVHIPFRLAIGFLSIAKRQR